MEPPLLRGTEDPSGFPQRLLSCRILLTADAHNVDPDVFHAVHSNGLVYASFEHKTILPHHNCVSILP